MKSCICIHYSVRYEAVAEIKQPMLIIYTYALDCWPTAPQTDEPARGARSGSQGAEA